MKNQTSRSIYIGLYVVSILLGIALHINRTNLALTFGSSVNGGDLSIKNDSIGKSIALVLAVGLLFLSYKIGKKLIEKNRFRLYYLYLLFSSVVYSLACTVTFSVLKPSFDFSIISHQSYNDVFGTKAPFALLTYFGTVGLLLGLSASTLSLITVIKEKEYNINLDWWSQFLIFIIGTISGVFFYLQLITNATSTPAGLIVSIIFGLIIGLSSCSIGNFLLPILHYKIRKMSPLNFIEEASQFLLASFGLVSSLIMFNVILSGFDPSLIAGIEYLPKLAGIYSTYILVISIIVVVLWKIQLRYSSVDLRLGEVSSELSFLKSQINPHFLFNSLNSIYGIALAEKSPKTADGVQKLSEMMRFMLKENTQEKISLNKEIEYIHNYIDLQSLRLDTNKHVQLNVSIEQPCDGNISPMLLIPMIENAFKHGVSIDKPSFIDIALKCNEHYVSLNVKNSNHHKEKTAAEESGIGLENVRKRLELLYPEKHLFQVYENEETYEAFIKIELA